MYVDNTGKGNDGHPFITGIDSDGIDNPDQLRKTSSDHAQEVLGEIFIDPPVLIRASNQPSPGPGVFTAASAKEGTQNVEGLQNSSAAWVICIDKPKSGVTQGGG